MDCSLFNNCSLKNADKNACKQCNETKEHLDKLIKKIESEAKNDAK